MAIQETLAHLRSILADYSEQLRSVSEAEWELKPNPAKWSKKEVLGHLVDSAQNNIRRFIVAQYEENPKITYAQDLWVAAANYQYYTTGDLLDLWILLNRHMCSVLAVLPPGAASRTADTGELCSIEFLASDYNKHLLHHLHQVLGLDPILYP
jgi:DinB superfamily